MGSGDKAPVAAERDVARVARRSLHWRRSLPAGHVVGDDDLDVLRPGTGLAPALAGTLVGRRTGRRVAAGSMIKPADLEGRRVTDAGPVRSLAVLTTGRQDWGILRSTCLAIRDETDVRLDVVAGGTHLLGPPRDDDRRHPRGRLRAVGARLARGRRAGHDRGRRRALRAVGDHLRATRPDALLLVGDRSRRRRPPSPRRSSASRSPTSTAASRRWARSTTRFGTRSRSSPTSTS